MAERNAVQGFSPVDPGRDVCVPNDMFAASANVVDPEGRDYEGKMAWAGDLESKLTKGRYRSTS